MIPPTSLSHDSLPPRPSLKPVGTEVKPRVPQDQPLSPSQSALPFPYFLLVTLEMTFFMEMGDGSKTTPSSWASVSLFFQWKQYTLT